jgi:L-ascorbate metabolism protein UlaG (beta-lactamase superfamily)
MLNNIHWIGHSSFRIDGPDDIKIYLDPYKLKSFARADLILITHDHSDHCSPEDINRLCGPQTIIAGPASIAAGLSRPVRILSPGKTLEAAGVSVEAVPAYNPAKQFHPKSSGNLGYIVTVNGVRIYHAGDTDYIPEMRDIKADIALLPVGGTYTMDAAEAAQAAAVIKPKIAVPMHWGTVVGSIADAEQFKKLCKDTVITIMAVER